ncbi:caspase-1-like isoform X2 [Pecten maximus]|uniref:caspase-1-like isoform X2 n=1 Tax=Pecten maximus TaxID=6579 RepID=UPI0014581263|nr:caspase-1-like isoform X2 [Pecten maximus]
MNLGFIERLALREAEEREGSRVTLAAAEYVPKEAEAEQTSEDSNESSEETQETIPKIAETEQIGEETQENMYDVRAKEAAEAEQTRDSEESKETPEVSQENVAETENSDTDEQKQDNLGEARVSGLDYINLIGYCASNQHQINSWPSQSSMKESGTKPKRQRVYQRVENVRLEEYRMTRIPRGKAVIFNIEKFNNSTDPMLRDRTGSSVDADGIERIFRRLHFDVERFNDHDCSFNKIDKELKTLAYDTDHQDNDCLAIFLLTHGRNGQLLDANCKSFDLTPLRKYFYASNCKTLAGKPKMFFIQACQGPQRQGIVYKRIEEDVVALKPSEVPVTPVSTSGDDYTNQSPDEADFLLCNSTPPGYVSYRDTENGTWFISTFIETLERDCNSFDINDILLRMNRILGEKTGNLEGNPCAQIASITSSLRRKVFLRTMPNT